MLRSNNFTDKINSDLGTVSLAGSTSHTGCTQALWRKLGVHNGGCEVAFMCLGSATAASKSLQGRSERGRISQEMSWLVPETGNSVPCRRYALFGSLMNEKDLTGTITRYTQGVLVGESHLPLGNIFQLTDFTFANFTQASSHG